MGSLEMREHIHKLVDEADEVQLNAVLEILKTSSDKYSQQDLESFYEKLKVFQEGGSNGYSVLQSHQSIRDKYKQGGL